jgi:RNA polymerase sigma-70 factor (ECF subfamily)
METDSSETVRWLEQAAAGDQASFAALWASVADRLGRMIALRFDPHMAARMDVADVLQEAQLEAWQHLADYRRNPAFPFYLWLRGLTANKLLELHRRHLGTRMRDARRETPLFRDNVLEASSHVFAAHLVDTATSPSHIAMRDELKARLATVIEAMTPDDREVLSLRHFEQLTPSETALVLQVSKKAAGMRYLRALKRLKDMLSASGEYFSELKL